MLLKSKKEGEKKSQQRSSGNPAVLKAAVAAAVFSFRIVFFLALSSQQLDRSDFNCDSGSSVLPASDGAVDPITKQLLSLAGRGRAVREVWVINCCWSRSSFIKVARRLKTFQDKINVEGFPFDRVSIGHSLHSGGAILDNDNINFFFHFNENLSFYIEFFFFWWNYRSEINYFKYFMCNFKAKIANNFPYFEWIATEKCCQTSLGFLSDDIYSLPDQTKLSVLTMTFFTLIRVKQWCQITSQSSKAIPLTHHHDLQNTLPTLIDRWIDR